MIAEPYPEQADGHMGECRNCDEMVMWSIDLRYWVHTLTWSVECEPVGGLRFVERLLTGQEP